MTNVLKLAVMTLLLAAADPLAATPAEEPSIEGVYAWNGIDQDGEEIGGLVHVVRHGGSFLVAWMMSPDDTLPAAVGVGVAEGDMFAVLFYAPLADIVVLYRIEDGGRRLVGRWVDAGGDGEVHTDVLTRLPRTPSLKPR